MLLMTENDIYNFVYKDQKDMFIQLNEKHEIVFVNTSFCKTFNVDETLVVGKKIWEFLNEKLRVQVDKEIKLLNKFKTFSKTSYKIRLGNKKSIWQEWSYYAILNKEKRVSRYFIIAKEVEENKSIDYILSFQRELLSSLNDSETLKKALEILIDRFSKIGIADSGILYTFNKTDNVFYLKHYINLNENFLSEKKVYNKIYEEYQDAMHDHVKYIEQINDLKGEGIQSLIKIPMKIDEESVGILVLASHKNSLIQTSMKFIVEALKLQISSIMLRLKINEEYETEHKKIDVLLSILPDMIYRFNRNGIIKRIDKNGGQADIPLPDDILSMLKNGFENFKYKKPQKYNYKMTKNNMIYTYETRIIKNSENDLLLTIKDQSHLQELEQELLSVKNKLNNILQCGDIGYWELDLENNTVYYNNIYLRLLGYAKDDIDFTVKEWNNLLYEDDRDKVWHTINEHAEKDTLSFEVKTRIKTKIGAYKWELLRGKVIKKSDINKPLKIIGVNVDITNIRKVEEKVKEHYITDSLTHLYNKKYFIEELEKEFNELEKKTEYFSLALISIDKFDEFSKLYGDDIGDFIIEKFAGFLKNNIRTGDVIARYNREKFLILMKNIKKNNSKFTLKRLQENLNNTKKLFGNVELELTFSAVVCDMHDVGSSISKEQVIDKLSLKLTEENKQTSSILII